MGSFGAPRFIRQPRKRGGEIYTEGRRWGGAKNRPFCVTPPPAPLLGTLRFHRKCPEKRGDRLNRSPRKFSKVFKVCFSSSLGSIVNVGKTLTYIFRWSNTFLSPPHLTSSCLYNADVFPEINGLCYMGKERL